LVTPAAAEGATARNRSGKRADDAAGIWRVAGATCPPTGKISQVQGQMGEDLTVFAFLFFEKSHEKLLLTR
jgi:hypothetical protein